MKQSELEFTKKIINDAQERAKFVEDVLKNRKELELYLTNVIENTRSIDKELHKKDITFQELQKLQELSNSYNKILDFIYKNRNLIDKEKEIQEILKKKRRIRINFLSILSLIASIIALLYAMFELGVIEWFLNILVQSASANDGNPVTTQVDMSYVFYGIVVIVSILGIFSFFYSVFGNKPKSVIFCRDVLKIILGFYAGIISSVVGV